MPQNGKFYPVKNTTTYEVHITIEQIPSDTFIELCKILKLKPILIENDTGSGNLPQLMTSRFYRLPYKNTLDEVKRCEKFFEYHKIKVLRSKIEFIIPKNSLYLFPADMPSILYQEFHTKYYIPLDKQDTFCYAVERQGGHTSTNSLKNPEYIFVTSRDQKSHEALKRQMSRESYIVLNSIHENVVFDTNPSLDVKWNQACLECPLKS